MVFSIFMQNQNENEQQEKQKFFPHIWQEAKDAFSSKKAWVLLVFFLVLLFIGGFVPVGKIPFLRNLAYAMGYTPDETQKISLLRALFSWNEHQKILRGELPDPDAVSIFGEGGGFLTAAGARAQNKLINMRAVNSSLARRGQAQDALRGSSYSAGAANTQQDTDVKITNTNVSAATQANAAKVGDVYFGQDASVIARDKRDGYNSVNTLKKIANPNIAGGSKGPDWFDRLVDKATRSDPGLANIAKNVDKNGMLAKIGEVRDQGNNKAQKDMYYAWLFGKTARRTPNPVLKKTLAAASFNGGEMPKSVFSASGFSGVGINPDDVIADMDDVAKYLAQDKDCQEAMKAVGNTVDVLKDQIFSGIRALRFPSTCADAQNNASAYTRQLQNINAQCKKVFDSYANDLRSQCGSLNPSLGKCDNTDNLSAHLAAFLSYCENEANKCTDPDPVARAQCVEQAKKISESDFSSDTGRDSASKQKKDSFGVDDNDNPVWGDDDPRHENGFVPQIGWGGKYWLGNNY